MVIKREIVLANRKRADIVVDLRQKEFKPFPKIAKAHVAGEPDAENELEETADQTLAGSNSDFDYLLQMALSSLTQEKVSI